MKIGWAECERPCPLLPNLNYGHPLNSGREYMCCQEVAKHRNLARPVGLP